MKTILFCMLLSFFSNDPNEPKTAKPKWDDYDKWRKNLRAGMTTAGVENLLGKPLYIQEFSNGAIAFYQYMPFYDEKEKKLSFDLSGTVIYRINSKEKSLKPIYTVYRWNEPKWDNVKPIEKKESKKTKPIRKLELSEKKESWDKLRLGLQDQAVRKTLGEPKTIKRNIRFGGGIYSSIFSNLTQILTEYPSVFVYDVCGLEINLYFEKGGLAAWETPFWPLVEKMLYKEVENENATKM